MFEYQERGIEWLLPKDRAFLADEAGLGKSRQLLLSAKPGPTLVIAPAMVIDGGVWTDEIARWRPELEVMQRSYHSIVAKQKDKNDSGRTVVRWTDKLDPELAGQRWANVFFDEAHHLKGRATTWTKAAYALSKNTDRLVQATGTPIPNYAHELYVSLTLLRPQDSIGGGYLGSYWRWAQQWFVVGPKYSKSGRLVSQYNVDGSRLKACGPSCDGRPANQPCDHWSEFHQVNFGGLFLQRLRDDVLTDLPPLTEQQLDLPMGREQAKLYAEIQKDFVSWVEETGTSVVAWSTAAQFQRLMMASTGIPTVDPDATRGSAKLDALAELLVGRSQPSLVLCHYRNTAAAIVKLCDKLRLRYTTVGSTTSKRARLAAVQGFQAGQFDVLVGSIEVVAEGLTLTRADEAIFVERHWRPDKNRQAMRRVHRIGQTRPVTVRQLRTRGTLDEDQWEALALKMDNQLRALNPHQALLELGLVR